MGASSPAGEWTNLRAMSGSMQTIGRVGELRRYPVKSMAGESIAESGVAPGRGLTGDRAWALRDIAAGEIRGAKKIPELLDCRARYLDPPEQETSARVEIDLGPLGRVCSGDPDVSARISLHVGREVRLCPRLPASEIDHYRRAKAITDSVAEIREASALRPEEAVPDLESGSADLSILSEYVSPPGSYFDFFDLHLLSEKSLASLAARAPQATIDAARFRPNLLVDLDASIGPENDFPELDFVGRRLQIGETELEVVMPMMRCVMTTHAQQGLPREPSIMRTLVREGGMNLGVGIQVRRGGWIRAGDEIRVAGRLPL